MRILPTTSRTAVSAAWITASEGFLLSNSQARASLRRYCTANLISTMFSSSVSMADSRRPVLLMMLSRPTSAERICVTNTSSWRSIGYGRRQLKPAPTELLYLPNWVMTACWPSCTMKKPVPIQITKTIPAIRPTPTPALFMSGGWKPPLPAPPVPRPPPPPLPPNRPPSLRLRSRHSSSRSGGWPLPWPLLFSRPRLPAGGGAGGRSSGRAPSSGLSSPRPQRGSFRLNMPRIRSGSEAQRRVRLWKFMRKVSGSLVASIKTALCPITPLGPAMGQHQLGSCPPAPPAPVRTAHGEGSPGPGRSVR